MSESVEFRVRILGTWCAILKILQSTENREKIEKEDLT